MMELSVVLEVLQGWLFLLIVFAVGLGYAMFKGRQALINLIMGLYLALFLYNHLPFKEKILDQAHGATAEAAIILSVFAALVFISTLLFGRLMPREYLEGAFETLGTKLILALLFAVLVMVLGEHFLPLDTLIKTGTPLPGFLTAENLAFWWLILPLAVLFFI